MFKINRVEAENFLSYRSIDIDMGSLEEFDFPCFVVTGENLDDGSSIYKDEKFAGSNGSGKTSLFESISWCLYGVIPRGVVYKDDIINIWGGDKCRVSVEFSVEDDVYKITRVKKAGSSENVVIIKNSENITKSKIKSSNKKIEEILNMDFNSFCMTGFLFETNYSQFGSSTDKEKKEKLSGLIPEHIRGLREYIGEDKTKVEGLLNRLEDIKIHLNSRVSLISSQISGKRREVNTVSDKMKEVSVGDMDFIKKELGYNVSLLSDLESMLEENRGKISKIDENMDNGGKWVRENQEKLDNRMRLKRDKEKKLEEEKRKLSNLGEIDSRLVCPTCDRKYDKSRVEEIKSKYDKAKREIVNNITNIESELKNWKEDGALQGKIEKAKKMLSDMKEERRTIMVSVNKYKENMSEVEKNIKEYKNKIESSDVYKYEVLLNSLNEQIKELEKDMEKYTNRVSDVESDIKSVRSLLGHVDFWYGHAGWDGIISYYMDDIIKNIEHKANEILNEISDDILISISSYKLNKSGDANNNIKIDILSGDKRKPYKMASSGERKKVDLSITLSIRDIYNSRVESSLNMMVLDEVFKGLDTSSSISLIRYLPVRYKDINIFLVSHDSSVNKYILSGQEVKVTKKKGISSISYWPGKEVNCG